LIRRRAKKIKRKSYMKKMKDEKRKLEKRLWLVWQLLGKSMITKMILNKLLSEEASFL
jgi:hypothetical protein